MKTLNTIKKTVFAILLAFIFSLSTVTAQNDPMYRMKAGALIGQYNVNTEVDSVIFYKPTIEEATSGTFTDTRDNNVYNWVTIGNQVWMAENLAYLPSVNQRGDGSEDLAGSYYYVYGYDGTVVADAKATSNYATYGVLYNWNAVMDGASTSSTNPSGVQGVCPDGWHVPSDEEWKELEMELGMNQSEADDDDHRGTNEGSKLAGNASLWADGELVNNSEFGASGFTALPGGFRNYGSYFSSNGYYGYWWSSTESPTPNAWYRILHYNYSNVIRYYDVEDCGFSVRCVRD